MSETTLMRVHCALYVLPKRSMSAIVDLFLSHLHPDTPSGQLALPQLGALLNRLDTASARLARLIVASESLMPSVLQAVFQDIVTCTDRDFTVSQLYAVMVIVSRSGKGLAGFTH